MSRSWSYGALAFGCQTLLVDDLSRENGLHDVAHVALMSHEIGDVVGLERAGVTLVKYLAWDGLHDGPEMAAPLCVAGDGCHHDTAAAGIGHPDGEELAMGQVLDGHVNGVTGHVCLSGEVHDHDGGDVGLHGVASCPMDWV